MNGDLHDSSRTTSIDTATLNAYVDGQLPEAEQAAVRARLAQDDEASACVNAWRAQRAALQALCAQTGTNAPSFVVLRVRASWPRRFAVAACWLLTGAGVGLFLDALPSYMAPSATPAAFARRADIAYAVYAPEARHPVEIAASDESHLVTWLSKRLDRPVSAPTLQEYGYTLVGGRLLPGDDTGPAAQFMYQDGTGARLTLYVAPASSNESTVRLLRAGNRSTLYWVTDRTGYALSGTIPETKLRAIAVDVCSELGGKPQLWR